MYQYNKTLTKSDIDYKRIQINKEGLSCFKILPKTFDLICYGSPLRVSFSCNEQTKTGIINGLQDFYKQHPGLKEGSEVRFNIDQENQKVHLYFDVPSASSTERKIAIPRSEKEKLVCDLLEYDLREGSFCSLQLIKREYPLYDSNGIIGYIDFLCVDRNTNDYVVIEVKVDDTKPDTVGQIKAYMNWLKDKEGENVKGIILINEQNKETKLLESALKGETDISLKYFNIKFQLYSDPRCTTPCK